MYALCIHEIMGGEPANLVQRECIPMSIRLDNFISRIVPHAQKKENYNNNYTFIIKLLSTSNTNTFNQNSILTNKQSNIKHKLG